VAAEVFLLSVGLRNVFGFGIGYAVTPWIAALGYAKAFGTMVAINSFILGFGLPLWYYGKRIRIASAKWKVINW
jgi:hypothetical protein